MRNPSSLTSNWRAQNDLEAELIEQGVVGIQGVDTRAITRHLRDRGAMRVGIFSGLELSREEMVVEVRKADAMAGAYLVRDVQIAVCRFQNQGPYQVSDDRNRCQTEESLPVITLELLR